MEKTEVKPEESTLKAPELEGGAIDDAPPLENTQKSRWERSWPTIACGAGLFSDGYLNGVCPTVTAENFVNWLI